MLRFILTINQILNIHLIAALKSATGRIKKKLATIFSYSHTLLTKKQKKMLYLSPLPLFN